MNEHDNAYALEVVLQRLAGIEDRLGIAGRPRYWAVTKCVMYDEAEVLSKHETLMGAKRALRELYDRLTMETPREDEITRTSLHIDRDGSQFKIKRAGKTCCSIHWTAYGIEEQW